MELPQRTLTESNIILQPISDLQLGAVGCDLNRFKRWFQKGLDTGAYFYGGGDYVDGVSPSGRKKIQDADFYDGVHADLEKMALEHYEKVRDILLPGKGRFLFLLQGHHYYQWEDGRHTDVMLARDLDCPFLGTSTVFQLNLPVAGRRGTHPCQIFYSHGQRAFKSTALGLRWLEMDVAPKWPTVDVVNVAHCHRAGGYTIEGMVPRHGTSPVINGKKVALGLTGGWLKGYVVGSQRAGRPQGGYIEMALMPPTSIGGITINVETVKAGRYSYLDMQVTS